MDELKQFYEALKAGMSVGEFLTAYERFDTHFRRQHGLVEDYRLASRSMKKFCDEVRPVTRLVKAHATPTDRVQFNLSDQCPKYPDCTVTLNGRPRDVEVTVARAMERLYLMTELNAKGEAPGYIPLQDNAPHSSFRSAVQREQLPFCEDETIADMVEAIRICITKKRKFRGDVLLIEAPLDTLEDETWFEAKDLLSRPVGNIGFQEVYLTGRSETDICIQLK